MLSLAAQELLERGRLKGHNAGRTQTAREKLLRLLTRRFKSAVEPHRAAIDAAPLDQLDDWFDRAIDAETIDAVFNDAP